MGAVHPSYRMLCLLWGLLGVGSGLLATTPRSLWAAGPRLVHTSGAPYRWSTAEPILYRCDPGSLGALNNASARHLVAEAFQVWEDVPTSAIAFDEGTLLPEDVGPTNYSAYLGAADGVNGVLFDADGSLVDAYLGAGNSNYVVAFAVIERTDATTGAILEGTLLLNGRFLDGVSTDTNPELSRDAFLGRVVHEIGHFLNLDHTQLQRAEFADDDAANDETIPTMFPLPFGAGREAATLHRDDVAAVSDLYPEAAFAQETGSIEGTVYYPGASSTTFQGMNVIARLIDDPQQVAVAAVSGALYRSSDGTSGTTDTAYRGRYRIAGLPPGRYTVAIEAIDGRFGGTARVGPVDPPVFGGVFEYWNGYAEGHDPERDPPMERVAVPVLAGRTLSGIDFQLNRSMGFWNEFGKNQSQLGISHCRLVFTPSPTAPAGYTVRRLTGWTQLPHDDSNDTPLLLDNDSYTTATLPGTVTIFGTPYQTVNICANGFLTFGRGASLSSDLEFTEFDYTPTATEHFGPRPHLSALYTDLQPGTRGSVRLGYSRAEGLYVTYRDVPVAGSQLVTFQLHVAPDGTITFAYLEIRTGEKPAIVGISSGGDSTTVPPRTYYTLLDNDTAPPTVTITQPADGATVSGSSVILAASFSDPAPSSGISQARLLLDGQVLATASASPISFTLNTQTRTNGPKRVEVEVVDRGGHVGTARSVLVIRNPGALELRQTLDGIRYDAPYLHFTLRIENVSTATASDVTLESMWLEGTGAFPGVRRIPCQPAAGAALPRNLGGLGPGQAVTLEFVAVVSEGVASIRRWVNTGTARVASTRLTF